MPGALKSLKILALGTIETCSNERLYSYKSKHCESLAYYPTNSSQLGCTALYSIPSNQTGRLFVPNFHIHTSASDLHIFPGSVHLFCCRQIGRPIAHRYSIWMYRNWDWGRAVSFRGIFFPNFRQCRNMLSLPRFRWDHHESANLHEGSAQGSEQGCAVQGSARRGRTTPLRVLCHSATVKGMSSALAFV